MCERNPNPRNEVDRTLQHSLELQLSELRTWHASNADSLKEAFSPGVIQLLRTLSEEDSFFQYSPVSTGVSSETSSRTTDFSGSLSREDSPVSSDSESMDEEWSTTRRILKFLYEEFMRAPTDQQMEVLNKFLDQVKGSASRIRFPGGASLSPDRNAAVRQCVTMVKTLNDVISSKFGILHNYVKVHTNQNPVQSTSDAGTSSFSCIRQPGDHVPNLDPSGSAPERNESIFRYVGPRNPEVVRLIGESNATSDIGMAGQQTIEDVPRTSQLNPGPSSSRGFEVGRQEGSSPPRKRPPLQRQDHVTDEEE